MNRLFLNMAVPRCYMCDLPGTTDEHIPPRAIFPEAKDAEGRNYRIDLITVPSCPDHNTAKSDDDEFLMVSLAGIMATTWAKIRVMSQHD